MEKEIAKEINEGKQKEKEEKQVKWTVELGLTTNQTAQKCVEKHVRTKFIAAWTLVVVTKVGDYFHQEFQESLCVDPHKYKGVNMGCTTWTQQHARL
jgi:hypothetical protein